jgi:hypothetical protein
MTTQRDIIFQEYSEHSYMSRMAVPSTAGVGQYAESLEDRYAKELAELEEAHFVQRIEANVTYAYVACTRSRDEQMEGEGASILSPFLPSTAEQVHQLCELAGVNVDVCVVVYTDA